MTFDHAWDAIYAAGKQDNYWPWSDLVSLVARHFRDAKGKQVLELGCGTGNNAAMLKFGGAYYTGIDSVDMAKRVSWATSHMGRFLQGDFSKEIPKEPWDLICDRAAVTHNDSASIDRCIRMCFNTLAPGGLYIGIDWFSACHADAILGVPVDSLTRTDIESGQFKGCGTVHFSTHQSISKTFTDAGFEIVELRHKTVTTHAGERTHIFAAFDIVARRPG